MQKARFFCPALKTLGRYTFLLRGPTKNSHKQHLKIEYIWNWWKRSAQARSVDIFITRLRGHGRRCSKRFGLIRTVCRHILLRSQNLSDSTIKSLNFKDTDLHIVSKKQKEGEPVHWGDQLKFFDTLASGCGQVVRRKNAVGQIPPEICGIFGDSVGDWIVMGKLSWIVVVAGNWPPVFNSSFFVWPKGAKGGEGTARRGQELWVKFEKQPKYYK